jgi:anti-anti-sigma factor
MTLMPPLFELLERDDPDGALRLEVLGELDVATAASLDERLTAARRSRRSVRLDLSETAFMDSTGLHTVIRGVRDAQRLGLLVEVDTLVSESVAAVLRLAGAQRLLWPDRDVLHRPD